MKKIVVFGIGRFFQNRKMLLQNLEDIEIVSYIDNKSESKEIDGVKVSLPASVQFLEYDIILLMSLSMEAMREQLLELGVPLEKIWTWNFFYSYMKRGQVQIYGKNLVRQASKKVLIISHDLGYHGGSIAASYAAAVLGERGYQVVLSAPSGDRKFIDEMVSKGMVVMVCPALSFVQEEELAWISLFDVVIVNTFPMVNSAYSVSRVRPVLWWIHECSDRFTDNYGSAMREFTYYSKSYDFSDIHISTVGELAKENFEFYYPNAVKDILVYGIPDKNAEIKDRKKQKEKIIFSLIGGFCERKAQKLWIEAIQKISAEEKEKCEFWMIGNVGGDEYSVSVLEAEQSEESIKVLGQMSREEIEHAYEEIDVVVCPSLEEIVPITITEGMMYEKICVVTSASSTASYIRNGQNGFICEAGDVDDLTEKMKWIINNIDLLGNMRKEARKTYEDIFSMSVFADNLEKAITETMENYDYGCNKERERILYTDE